MRFFNQIDSVVTAYEIEDEDMRGASLEGMIIDHAASASEVDYTGASFAGLLFTATGSLHFRNADLTDSNWIDVDTSKVTFKNVNLTGAKLSLRQLTLAKIDRKTILPAGITRDDITREKMRQWKAQNPAYDTFHTFANN